MQIRNASFKPLDGLDFLCLFQIFLNAELSAVIAYSYRRCFEPGFSGPKRKYTSRSEVTSVG